jgi:hypothetical protein
MDNNLHITECDKLASNDDSKSEGGLLENGANVQTSTGDTNAPETTSDEAGKSSSTENSTIHQVPVFSGPYTITARSYLNQEHGPRHELAANIIDEWARLWNTDGVRNNPYSYNNALARWSHYLNGPEPSEDDIDELRWELHAARNYSSWQHPCKYYQIKIEDAKSYLEYLRTKNRQQSAAEFKIELQERTEEDELRTKVLWYEQDIKSIREYEAQQQDTAMPTISEESKAILAVDFYEARTTYKEWEQLHDPESPQEDNVHKHYTRWVEFIKRFQKSP